jgi:precorrin-3B synthase
MAAAVERQAADACPGALRPHHAADGELVRIRVPGGTLALTALRGLAAASAQLADGRIGLTSRGNVQVRGVSADDVERLAGQLRAAGLLPDAEHERVRNIIASPLSGRGPGSIEDVDPLVEGLDLALCARPGLAQLPGRFLFALDDGTGDVLAEGADVVAVALGGGRFLVQPAGVTEGLQVGAGQVVGVVLALAEAFLAERAAQGSRAWRIGELPGGGAAVLDRVMAWGEVEQAAADAMPQVSDAAPAPASSVPPLPVAETALPWAVPGPSAATAGAPPEPGLIEQRDGRFAVCALTPLGLLDQPQLEALIAAAELSEAEAEAEAEAGPEAADRPTAALKITPWRRIVLRDLNLPAALAARELLDAAGLIVTPGTAWSRVTACAGRPGCAKSLTDVHADAKTFAAGCDQTGPAVHWAGCERGCGTPAGIVVQLLATPDGYRAHGELTAQDAARAGIGTP